MIAPQDSFDIGRFTARTEQAWTLPAPYFYAPEVFAAEEQAIFRKSWRVVGHASQLAGPGDYLTQDICGNGVFVVRGRDGGLRGFHNVCRHRAHQLLGDRQGNLKQAVVCPYHGWTYDFDGGLRAAGPLDEVADFRRGEFGLAAVAVEQYCGFVFVNLDPGAKPLAGLTPGFEAALRRFIPDLDTMAWTSRQDFDIAANWKVVVENSIDWGHVYLSGPAHRDFGKLVDRDSVAAINGRGWIMLHAGEGSADNEAYDFRPNIGKGQTSHYATFYLWPDLLIFTYPHVNACWSFLMAPEGPERTRQEIAAFTPQGAQPDPITEKAIGWMNDVLGPEDVALNVGVQKGLKSDSYFQGRLLIAGSQNEWSEHTVHYFQTLVLEALGRLPEGSSAGLSSDVGRLPGDAVG